MKALIAVSNNPRELTALYLAQNLGEIIKDSHTFNKPPKAFYHIKRPWAKGLVYRIDYSHPYEPIQDGL